MNNYKSFSELKKELGNNYDFKLYEMGISALKEIENLKQENQELKLELSGYRQAILEDKDMLGLKEESEELKKQLEVGNKQYCDLVEEKEILQEQLSIKTLQLEELKSSKRDYTQENILEMKMFNLQTQQKEFIDYMNKTIEELECDDVDDEEMKGYLIQRIDIFKEILKKYNEKVTDINVGSMGGKE